jgi:intracellular multiplication protein IcmP
VSQQQKSPHEEFILTVVILGLLGGAGYAIWYFFHTELTQAVRWIRWAELWIDKVLVGDDYAIDSPSGRMTVAQWRAWLRVAPVDQIEPMHIKIMTELAVPPLKFLIAGIIGLMGLFTIFFGHGTQYRRRMNLEALMREQARSFPSIQPFLKFDPRKLPARAPGAPVPSQLPMFAEALSPEEWIAYHEVPYVNGRLDPNKAWQALSLQLGKRWQGADKLPLHAQGLFAVCAYKHVRKRKDSEALLDALSLSWSAEKGFKPPAKVVAEIRKVLKDPKLGGSLSKYADQHAYETTALLRALSVAREQGGVLAPAQFLWLRGHDRTLWYPMNNLGRKSYHAEAAGALVHYTNEIIAGQKIPTPRFDEVLRAFEGYLKSGMRVIPPLEKKAGGKK